MERGLAIQPMVAGQWQPSGGQETGRTITHNLPATHSFINRSFDHAVINYEHETIRCDKTEELRETCMRHAQCAHNMPN